MKADLFDYCQVATQREDFVGICFEFDEYNQVNQPKITFPYGYHYTANDDIFCLVKVLSEYQNELQKLGIPLTDDEKQGFPINAYMIVIQDYLVNGYYTERENIYKSQTHGKVNWGRTVKKEKPIIQNNGVIYTNLQTRLHHTNGEHIITEISKHCVYESMCKFGWFYGLSTPNKPNSILRKSLFIATLQDRLHKSNKDIDKHLFCAMIDILNSANENHHNQKNFSFGTKRFEKVWEFLINKTFGTEQGKDKAKYFPKATWYLLDNQSKQSNSLLPDTIMINNDYLYVIDAKYYRYGITNIPTHLPEVSSIAKQITYAQYIDEKFGKRNLKIRNIFILPFNAKSDNLPNYHCSGWSTADWIADCDYKNIYIILLDTKYLMVHQSLINIREIKNLSAIVLSLIHI